MEASTTEKGALWAGVESDGRPHAAAAERSASNQTNRMSGHLIGIRSGSGCARGAATVRRCRRIASTDWASQSVSTCRIGRRRHFRRTRPWRAAVAGWSLCRWRTLPRSGTSSAWIATAATGRTWRRTRSNATRTSRAGCRTRHRAAILSSTPSCRPLRLPTLNYLCQLRHLRRVYLCQLRHLWRAYLRHLCHLWLLPCLPHLWLTPLGHQWPRQA